jgi:hypothetical protein
MKKILLVMALAAVLTLAFASSAFAYTPTPVYIAWDAAAPGNTGGPHANYTAASTKCAVCHSVHIAPSASTIGTTGGIPWAATAPTELLLRSSAGNSCRFCHIDTAIGGVQLYGGAGGVYTVWAGPGHRGYGANGCTMCHAVHGANTFKGANTSKILKLTMNHNGITAAQADIIGATNPNEAIGAGANVGLFDTFANAAVSNMKYEQQTVFCSECHGVFSRSADTTLASGFKGHSFVSAPSASFSATTGGLATQYTAGDAIVGTPAQTVNKGVTFSGAPVANDASSHCRACHDAGGVNQAGVSWNSFPHYTRGYPYFLDLQAGDGSLAGNTGVPVDTAADGNCIGCHNTVGTAF